MTTQMCLLTFFAISAAVPFNSKYLRVEHNYILEDEPQQQLKAGTDVEEQVFPSLRETKYTNSINTLQQPVQQQQQEAGAPVSYAGYKLFKTDVQEQLFPVVDSLDVEAGVEVWSCKKGKSNHYEMDLLTPPHAEREVNTSIYYLHLTECQSNQF